MGKQSRRYPTGHLRLYKTCRNGDGQPLTVQIEYNVKSVAVRRASGVCVKEKDWNPNENNGRGGVKAGYGPDWRNVNARLAKRLTELDERVADWCEKNPNQLSVDVLKALLDGAPMTRQDKGVDFGDYVRERLKAELNRNKIGQSVYKNGLSAVNIFGMFLKTSGLGTYKPDGIYVSEITPDLIEKYILWRKEVKNNTEETINHALTPLLKACQKAMIEGHITTQVNGVIQDMRIAKTTSLEGVEKEEVRHLSTLQISALIEFYHRDKEPRRKEYIEMFLFAMYACGLRFVDVLTLQWSDIDLAARTLNKIQVKTRARNIVPLSEQAIDILEKWQGRYSRFVFGLLPDDSNLDDAARLYGARNSKTRSVNQSLAVVGQKAGIPFDLSFHVARHTFAVQSLNNGLQMTMVSQLLGHSSTEITEKVYAHYIPAKMQAEISKINLPSI